VFLKANARSSNTTFESFLRESKRQGNTDPGAAMMATLRRRRVPGINVGQIASNPSLDPTGKPENILAFLEHIASSGAWGVNMSVNID
jgi:hypothetical protein